MASIKLATLNINGLTSPTRVAMLEVFFRLQEIDIVLLQEVTQHILDNLHGYTTYYNIGTTMRGTAIVTRDEIQLANMWSSNSRKIPRGVDNKYLCPCGTARRQEREQFYNSELAYLLRDAPENIILCGDFNCILKKTNSTGTYYYSQALVELVRGFKLQDSWQGDPSRKPTHIIPQQERPGYIAYTSHRSYSPGSLV